MSEAPELVFLRKTKPDGRGNTKIIYTPESIEARREYFAEQKRKADETRPVGTVKSSTNRRGTSYFRWDGTQWVKARTQEQKEQFRQLLREQQAAANSTYDIPDEGGEDDDWDPDKDGNEADEINKKPSLSTFDSKGKATFGSLGKFQPLRYPKERTDNNQDYIQFSIVKYERQGLTGGPVGSDFNVEGNINLLKNLLGSITLPIPSQIGDNNSVNYASGEMNFMTRDLLGIAESGISGNVGEAFDQLNALGMSLAGQENRETVKKYFAQQAIQSLGLNISLDQLLVRSSGAIINPNMELLFTSPNLRTFAFAFKFTPRFREEGEEVKQIIRTFKKYSSPKQGSSRNYLKAPDIFQIRYLGKNGGNHKFLNRFKLCALTQMSVNYTADGVYATYDNETPVSMIMTLNFQELTPIYAEEYDGTGGVGY